MTDGRAWSGRAWRASSPFAASVGLAAALLFAVQPLQAKLLLPVAGGTPLAWAVVTAFFQLAVLAGYVLAHVARRIVPRAALGPAVVVLLAIGAAWGPTDAATLASGSNAPYEGAAIGAAIGWSLVRALGVTVVALSMVSPIVQYLFAGAEARERGPGGRRPSDPYWLYAASNVGSVGILLAYPLTLARWWPLPTQSDVFRGGLLVLAGLVAMCSVVSHRPPEPGATAPEVASPRPPWPDVSSWVIRSAVASALVLAATNHVTTDLAPTPLLWSLPLAVYLGSFIVAFSRWGAVATEFARSHAPLLVVPLVPLLALGIAMPAALVTGVHLVALAAVCMALHGEVARTRPPPDRLTEFYAWLGLGGALGGVAVAFVAPAVFNGPWEYPLLVAGALLLNVRRRTQRQASAEPTLTTGFMADVPALVIAAALGAVLCLLWSEDPVTGTTIHYAPFAVIVLMSCRCHRWPGVASGAVAAFVLIAFSSVEWSRPVITRARSPFGSYRVAEDERRDIRYLAHGHTVHGAQRRHPPGIDWALPYWPPGSPAAEIVSAVQAPAATRPDGRPGRIAVLGLGVGAMATFIEPDGHAEFWEIDPEIVRLAHARFRFLDRCGQACVVNLGDGRLGLQRTPPGSYDLIVLDAFSSSAVPTHLLTLEAVEMYVRHLRPHGVLVVHITNHHVDLEPVLAAVSAELGLTAWHRRHVPDATETTPFVAPSRWMIIARTDVALDALVDRSTWSQAETRPDVAAWSDQHADLVDVLTSRPSFDSPMR